MSRAIAESYLYLMQLLEIHMPSIHISDFLYTEASAVAQRRGVDPDQVIEQWAMAGMVAPIAADDAEYARVKARLVSECRMTPPAPGDEHNWQHCIDELTGEFWVSKAAYEVECARQMRARGLISAVDKSSAVQSMHQLMDEAPAAGAGVDIKKLIEDGRS